MRQVLFKKWNPKKVEGITTVKPAYWDSEFKHPGYFHQWASAYEEFESGPANYTVALIEEPDGTITEVLPANIKFILDTVKG